MEMVQKGVLNVDFGTKFTERGPLENTVIIRISNNQFREA